MSVLGRLLRSLPFDPRSRRVLHECLADWRHESSMATTLGQRTVVHVRSVLAVVGVVVVLLWHDVMAIPRPRVLATTGIAVLTLVGGVWFCWQVFPIELAAPVPADVLRTVNRNFLLVDMLSLSPLFFLLRLPATVETTLTLFP